MSVYVPGMFLLVQHIYVAAVQHMCTSWRLQMARGVTPRDVLVTMIRITNLCYIVTLSSTRRAHDHHPGNGP